MSESTAAQANTNVAGGSSVASLAAVFHDVKWPPVPQPLAALWNLRVPTAPVEGGVAPLVPEINPMHNPFSELSEIVPGLYLGPESATSDRGALQRLGVSLVLTLNGERHIPPFRVFEWNPEKGKCLHRPIADLPTFVAELRTEMLRLYGLLEHGSAGATAPKEEDEAAVGDRRRIFVRSVLADDSPIFDLLEYFQELVCEMELVLRVRRAIDRHHRRLLHAHTHDDTTNKTDAQDANAKIIPPAVAVHCMAGVSRSSTIVAAYLAKFTRAPMETILSKVMIARRPIVMPNPGFRAQLTVWEACRYHAATNALSCGDVALSILHRHAPAAKLTSDGVAYTGDFYDGDGDGSSDGGHGGAGEAQYASLLDQATAVGCLVETYITTSRFTKERAAFGMIIGGLHGTLVDAVGQTPTTKKDAAGEAANISHRAAPHRHSLAALVGLVLSTLTKRVADGTYIDAPDLVKNAAELLRSIAAHVGAAETAVACFWAVRGEEVATAARTANAADMSANVEVLVPADAHVMAVLQAVREGLTAGSEVEDDDADAREQNKAHDAAELAKAEAAIASAWGTAAALPAVRCLWSPALQHLRIQEE